MDQIPGPEGVQLMDGGEPGCPQAFKEMEHQDELEIRGATFMVMKKKKLEDKDDEEQ